MSGMSKSVFKKRDIIIIGAALILCILFFAVRSILSGTILTGEVRVFLNGTLVKEMDLSRNEEYTVSGDNGRNTIVVRDGSVFMEHSDCKNHFCMDQGEINSTNVFYRPMGNRIICLPNRVEVEAVTGSRDNIPDI